MPPTKQERSGLYQCFFHSCSLVCPCKAEQEARAGECLPALQASCSPGLEVNLGGKQHIASRRVRTEDRHTELCCTDSDHTSSLQAKPL